MAIFTAGGWTWSSMLLMRGRSANSWAPKPGTDTVIFSGKLCTMRSLSALVKDSGRVSRCSWPQATSTGAMALPLG